MSLTILKDKLEGTNEQQNSHLILPRKEIADALAEVERLRAELDAATERAAKLRACEADARKLRETLRAVFTIIVDEALAATAEKGGEQ